MHSRRLSTSNTHPVSPPSRSPRPGLPALIAVLVGLGAAPASAQVAAPPPLAVNAQTFRPAIGPENVITVEGTRTAGFLKPNAGVLFEFAYQPLRLAQQSGATIAVPVDTMTTAHVMAGLGLWRWLSLSVDLPVILYQTAGQPAPIIPNTPSVAGLGDLRVVVKARLLNNTESGFGLAFVPQATFPTGSATDFRGASLQDTSVYLFEPRLALDYRFRRGAFIALNAGFQARLCPGGACDDNAFTTRISHLVTYGLGAYSPIAKGFGAGGEIIGGTSISSSDAGYLYSPLEGYLTARWLHRTGLHVDIGGGGAFVQAAGSAQFRVFAGVGYAPFGVTREVVVDRDRDGVPDKVDACPDQPGPARSGGCPEDRDGDGVFDEADACPADAAGPHPDAKRPGCPLTDKDGDGVFDDTDACPADAAGAHPDPKRPGCPLTDKDGDGVFDDTDACAEVPAGPHPDAKRPGCPDTDTDGDGVFDSADPCPQEASGLNPDAQRPGCPMADRDRDLVPDATDACPEQAGAPSADPKKNGCPGVVEVRGGMIVILKEIFFAPGKDVIQKKSFPVVQAIADTLQGVPAIKKVAIEGHTDNVGQRDKNVLLSDRRAHAVLRWLVQHGVSADRLEAHGYGPDRPIADNKTKAGQAKNRRVDLRITDPPQPASAAPATPPAAPAPAPAPGVKAPAPGAKAPAAKAPGVKAPGVKAPGVKAPGPAPAAPAAKNGKEVTKIKDIRGPKAQKAKKGRGA